MKKIKKREVEIAMKNRKSENVIAKKATAGITLVALVVTILFSYDYGRKCRNINKFLLSAD